MSDDGERPPLPVGRSWPRDRELDASECVDAACTQGQAPWRVHRSLQGLRLRWDCGGWVTVPWEARPAPVLAAPPAPAEPSLPSLSLRRDASGLVPLPVEPGSTVVEDIPTSLPMAPGMLLHFAYNALVLLTGS